MGYRWTERKLKWAIVPEKFTTWVENVLLHSTVVEAKQLHKKYKLDHKYTFTQNKDNILAMEKHLKLAL